MIANQPRITIYANGSMFAAAARRLESLGYPSLSAYLCGLVRADLMTPADHRLALKVQRMSPANRERIDRELIERLEAPPAPSTSDEEAAEFIARHLPLQTPLSS